MLKVNNGNNRTKRKICLNLTSKVPVWCNWYNSVVFLVKLFLWIYFAPCSSVSIVDFEHEMQVGVTKEQHTLMSEEIKNFTHSLLLKAHHHQRYQCSFALGTTLQSSNFCQWWNFLLILCPVKLWWLLH